MKLTSYLYISTIQRRSFWRRKEY